MAENLRTLTFEVPAPWTRLRVGHADVPGIEVKTEEHLRIYAKGEVHQSDVVGQATGQVWLQAIDDVVVMAKKKLLVSSTGATYVTELSSEQDLLGIFEITGDSLLLRGVAEVDERRPEQGLADVADAPGAAGGDVLLVEDDLLGQRGAAPAMRLRVGDAVVAGGAHHPAPLEPVLDGVVLVAGAAAAAQVREAPGELGLEPRADLVTEGALCVGQLQFHRGLLLRGP